MLSNDNKKRALNNACALLRQRPRSEAEMRSRLEEKGYDPATVDAVIGGLRKAGYIDDAKFVRMWIDSRMRSNPKGDVVLRHELKGKGVSPGLIEEALAEKSRRYDERGIALEMASEQFRRMKKLDRRKAAKRVWDFLARRGFGYDVIQDVINGLTDR